MIRSTLILFVCSLISAPSNAAGDVPSGDVTVTSRVRQTMNGWGLMPAPIDRVTPTYADGSIAHGDAGWLPRAGEKPGALHDTVCDLGFQIARVYLSPLLAREDGSLVPDRLRDLTDHLAVLRDRGITRYVITVWSPPPFWKVPDRVRYGLYQGRRQSLDPARADDYARFLASSVKAIVSAGFPPPEGLSIQNEPSTAHGYDGCVWTDTPEQINTYRDVVKRLRSRLDADGLKTVPILVPEEESLVGITKILGPVTPNGRFAAIESDPEFARAVGGFAFHTYATAGNIAELRRAMAAETGREVWMTEYSGPMGIRGELRPNSGDEQLDWVLNNLRRMAGDLVDLRATRWFFWRGWHPAGRAFDQDLVFDGPGKARAYHPFRALWHAVGSGWALMEVESTVPDLRTDNDRLIEPGSGDQWSAPVDVIAFASPARDRSVVLLVNSRGEARSVRVLNGLRGRNARVLVTDRTRDMAEGGERTIEKGRLSGAPLGLPPWSVTLVISEP